MAERLGRGLQNLVHRFESGSDLQNKSPTLKDVGLFVLGIRGEGVGIREGTERRVIVKKLILFSEAKPSNPYSLLPTPYSLPPNP